MHEINDSASAAQPEERSANPGYVLGQLAHALTTSTEHPDQATRERAQQKIARWQQVFQGMLSGALGIGSRTPVRGVPAWATLEVAAGGFATGTLLAGGPLQAHEQALLARLPEPASGHQRAALNAYYLTDEGLHELLAMIESGTYRIAVPEEGALLTIAWLLAHGHADDAREILEQIGPYLDQLRFYPIPTEQPLSTRMTVHLTNVETLVAQLREIKTPLQIAKQEEAILVWLPLLDQMVDLFVETVEGAPPTLIKAENGARLLGHSGAPIIRGGWPCQRYPIGWKARAQSVLGSYRRQRKVHQLCGKTERQGENFILLRRTLERCVENPVQLTGREVGMVRAILAHIEDKRGMPGSERCQLLRMQQTEQVAIPTHSDFAQLLIARLEGYAPEEGVPDVEPLLAPISTEEATRFQLPPGWEIPRSFDPLLLRALDAPLAELVQRGVIPSGDVMATLVPQLTAQIRAAGIADPALKRLAGAIYTAFRRRRSLLLFNLQHQVRFTELPWMLAIELHNTVTTEGEAQARGLLTEVAALTLRAFPQRIIPNKLLQEIRALAQSAGLQLPIVDELAADIFMGDFSEKYLRAAQIAAGLLEGSLYARYYSIDYGEIRRIDDVRESRHGAPASPAFAALCYRRAGHERGGVWSVARHGTIIEEQQILTTQNLAVLWAGLDLGTQLDDDLRKLSRRCLLWIFEQQQIDFGNWRSTLHMLKDTAYAWRQLIFYLSLQRPAQVDAFLTWAEAQLYQQPQPFWMRFRPAMEGLAAAHAGQPVPQPFLGWTMGRHWLQADQEER